MKDYEISHIFSEEELLTLWNRIDKNRDNLMFRLMYHLALRPSEVVEVDVRDINFKDEKIKIFVRKKGRRTAEEKRVGVKRKPIDIDKPVTDELLLKDLKFYTTGKQRGLLFPSRKKTSDKREKPLTVTQVEQLFHKYCCKVFGEPDFGEILAKSNYKTNKEKFKKRWNPHLLRHARAIHMLNKGVNVDSIRRVLVHTDLKVTQIYLNRSLEDVRQELLQKERRIMPYEKEGWE